MTDASASESCKDQEHLIEVTLKEVSERLNGIEDKLRQEGCLNIADFLIMHEEIRRTEQDLEVTTERLEELKIKKRG